MAKRIESPVTLVTRRTKFMYYNKHHQLALFELNPFHALNQEWFEECFHTAALQYGYRSLAQLNVLTPRQVKYHEWFTRLHDEVQGRLRTSLALLQKGTKGPPDPQDIRGRQRFPKEIEAPRRAWAPTPSTHPNRMRVRAVRDELARMSDQQSRHD